MLVLANSGRPPTTRVDDLKHEVGVRLFGTPAMVPSGDGRLELFVIAEDRGLWHIWQTDWSNGWSGWDNRGAPWGDPTWPPAAGQSGDGRDEVFVAAGDLFHMSQTAWSNGWSTWDDLGSPTPGGLGGGFWAPGVASNADGRLMAFVADGSLWRVEQTAWSNGWSGWLPHGAPPAGSPVVSPVAASVSGDGRLEVFVVDAGGAMWNVNQTSPAGPWSGWNSFGTAGAGFDDRPTVARSADGRLELFVRGKDLALWHRWELSVGPGAAWSNWVSHGSAGGGFTDHPALCRSADGRLELFVTGLDTNLWHIWQVTASSVWTGWVSHGSAGGGFGAAPALAPSGDGRLELFVVGSDGNLWHIWQTRASNGWSDWVSHSQPP
jgi:hypothetical protein